MANAVNIDGVLGSHVFKKQTYGKSGKRANLVTATANNPNLHIQFVLHLTTEPYDVIGNSIGYM